MLLLDKILNFEFSDFILLSIVTKILFYILNYILLHLNIGIYNMHFKYIFHIMYKKLKKIGFVQFSLLYNIRLLLKLSLIICW